MWKSGEQQHENKDVQRRETFAARFYATIYGRDEDTGKSSQRQTGGRQKEATKSGRL